MTPTFVDTAAWIVLINVRDALHVQAQSVYATLVQRKVPLVTSEFVLLEVADALSSPLLRPLTIAFTNRLRQGVLEIVPLDEALRQKGWVLYCQRPDKEWGLTDCISFVVMQEQGIVEAFTSDHHFTQAGFTILLSHNS
jgi:predicted nucleic acid-binding protein